MAIKVYKPNSPAQRGMSGQDFSQLTSKKPLKSLTKVKRSATGRNHQGRITTRHRGAGAKRFYRAVDYKMAIGEQATVEQIEYDPNRSAFIARVSLADGRFSYVLAKLTLGVKADRK